MKIILIYIITYTLYIFYGNSDEWDQLIETINLMKYTVLYHTSMSMKTFGEQTEDYIISKILDSKNKTRSRQYNSP